MQPNPNHLPEAVDALGLELTDEEVEELERPYLEYGPSWY
jgi:aryl-alcohol dehydrogenase-like predicted oxidoreductase